MNNEELVALDEEVCITANKMIRERAVVLLLSLAFAAYLLEHRFDSVSPLLGADGKLSFLASRNRSRQSEDGRWTEKLKHGVIARASNWTGPIPCLEPDEAMKTAYGFRQPATSGFLFLKLVKTGGSTATGIAMRIAKHTAERNNEKFWICQGRWDHSWAFRMLEHRERDHSFTWTILRDPTKRAISEYYHFEISRAGKRVSDASFTSYAKKQNLNSLYLRMLSTEKHDYVYDSEAPAIINQILLDYDFVGITERMDESAVALMMLIGAKIGDILFLNAKGSGGYDDGVYENTCFFIQPSRVTPHMQEFLRSDTWYQVTKWDNLLFAAANRSLDLTIDRLGRKAFNENLSKFRHAQEVARERCLSQEVFPCTSTGQHNEHASCLWSDSGCGYKCLNAVADELGLW